MPLLNTILERRARLIDYEVLTENALARLQMQQYRSLMNMFFPGHPPTFRSSTSAGSVAASD